jgi:hypothetical protein
MAEIMTKKVAVCFGAFVIFAFLTLIARAQMGGANWTPLPVKFQIHSPCQTNEASRYWITNGVSHFRTYRNDSAFRAGNTTQPRTEHRFKPDYTKGDIQYQAMFLVPANENSYSIFQIHSGDAQSPRFGSTTFMLFWFSKDGGSVHDYAGKELAANLGDKWFQLNVEHNVAARTINVWIDQKLVWTQKDNGAENFYMKDGVYAQRHEPTFQMDTCISNVLMWTRTP